MKKVSLLGLFLLATTTQFASANVAVVEGPVAATAAPVAVPGGPGGPGCPQAFRGFFLGGNIGYNVAVGRHSFILDDESARTRFKHGANGVDGGIGVGYNHRLCNWVIGIAFDANWQSVKGRHRFPAESFRTQVRLRNTLDLYARFGYVLRDIAMPFIGLGWESSQWRFNARELPGGERIAHSNKRRNAFLWKLGADFLATKHVIVGFEYTGTTTVTISHRGNDDFAEARGKVRAQPNKFALTAKIIY